MAGACRRDANDICYIWKISLTLTLTLVLIVISRVVLLLTVQQFFILQGAASDIALQNAQVFLVESYEGQAIASSLDFLFMLLLIFFLVKCIEKREFHLTDLGLNLHHNTPLFVGLGFAIGCAFFFGAAMFGVLFGTLEFPLSPNLSQWPFLSTLVAAITFYVLNSFWQEIVFRGYLQTRAVQEYGSSIGVTAVTVVFVIFHGFVQTITPFGILAGLLLFSFIGLLYDKTKSLCFVIVIHAVLNFLPVLFNTWWQGPEIIITYGIALALLLLLIRHTKQEVQLTHNTCQL